MVDKLQEFYNKLSKGNTFEEYDELFQNTPYKNEDINMEITVLIDLTVCNAGQITHAEHRSIGETLKELNTVELSPEYKKLLTKILHEVSPYISFVNANPYKKLRQKCLS